MLPKRVIIETPYAGDVNANMQYLADCMRDSILNHDEAPFSSHRLYTKALDDNKPDERKLGIDLAHAWLDVADGVIVYLDRGISSGMTYGINKAKQLGIEIEYRRLNK